MKKLFLSLALAATTLAGYSQTNPVSTFFNTTMNYFTSFNTNLSGTFGTGKRVDVWTGGAYQSGVNFGDDLGIDFSFSSGGGGIYAEEVTRNASIAGTIVNQRAGLGYAYVHIDTKLSIGVNGGYDFNARKPLAEVYGDVRKALTDNTFSGLRLAYQDDFSNKSPGAPVVTVFVGFTF